MAERYAVATGNWSAVGTWDGGASLPGASDDVHANTFTVTINQNITVLSIRTTAGTTASAGGSFVIQSGVIINADIRAGSEHCLNVTNQTVTVNGDVYGSDTTASKFGINVNAYPSTLTVVGDAFGGALGNAINQSAGNVTMTGNATGGSGSNVLGINLNGTVGRVIVTGNVTGGTGTNSYGAYLANGAILIGNANGSANAHGASIVNGSRLIGNATAGTANNIYGVLLQTGAVMIGDAFGGAGSNRIGAYITSSIFYGNATGGSVDGGYGIQIANGGIAHVLTATGTVSGAFGVHISSTGTWGFGWAIIDATSGSYPSSISSASYTDYTYTDFMDPAVIGAGGLLTHPSMLGRING